jgi:hypothetical protein
MQGTIYNFKVEARNQIGYSELSSPVAIRCAIKPSTPAAPTTLTVVNTALVSWTAPITDNGAEITQYKVMIR